MNDDIDGWFIGERQQRRDVAMGYVILAGTLFVGIVVGFVLGATWG